MAIKTIYISQVGRDYQISPHFCLGEMACKDGSDKVFYSTELMEMLEKLRAYGGFTIHINSGYRSPSYNKKIGGASKSQHTKGTAADIVVYKDGKVVHGKDICCLCQSLGFKGIGYISFRAVHVDMRESGIYRGDERKGYSGNVGNDFYKYFGIRKAEIEELKTPEEPQNSPKKEEEEEMVYKDMNEVPEWGREAVHLRVEHGWSDGKNIEQSLLRAWVAQDRENPYICDMKDLAELRPWAVPEVEKLIAAGKIKGNGVEEIGKRWQVLETCIIMNR